VCLSGGDFPNELSIFGWEGLRPFPSAVASFSKRGCVLFQARWLRSISGVSVSFKLVILPKQTFKFWFFWQKFCQSNRNADWVASLYL
tara:strand:- start:3872 stop:4135 length:264 start_codon:yes stop_codon:yes gene_type:complete